MKNLFISIIFIVCSFQMSIGQVTEPSTKKSHQELVEYYTLKQNKNRKAASICLKGGAILVVVGTTVAMAGIANAESNATPIGVGLVALGGISTIASIPLYVIAGNNKRKARMSLQANVIDLGGFNQEKSSYMAVALTIPL